MRTLPVKKVPSAWKALQCAVLELGAQGFSVSNWNDSVLFSPKEPDRRQHRNFPRALTEVARLATPTDDVAHRSREGSRGTGRRVHAAQALALLDRQKGPVQTRKQACHE